MLEKTKKFLREVINELKKVTWPSKKDVYATTILVILFSVFFGFYLWFVDIILGWFVQYLKKALG